MKGKSNYDVRFRRYSSNWGGFAFNRHISSRATEFLSFKKPQM